LTLLTDYFKQVDMDKKYVFHSSCYDKELLLKRIILLNDNTIDFKTIEKSGKAQFRAPLSGYFEVEIHIIEDVILPNNKTTG
jgi:hypothetical protein